MPKPLGKGIRCGYCPRWLTGKELRVCFVCHKGVCEWHDAKKLSQHDNIPMMFGTFAWKKKPLCQFCYALECLETPPLEVGQRVRFGEEVQAFTVQAASKRWAVCTKPLNAIRRVRGGYEHYQTVLYTIVDRALNVRGTDNLVFGHGYETQEECQDALEKLEANEMELSSRRRPIPLWIVSVKEPRRARRTMGV